MSRYDVGVVGVWYWPNYGSLLNSFATYRILKSFGLSALHLMPPGNRITPQSHVEAFIDAVYDKSEYAEPLPFARAKEYNELCGMFLTGSDQIWRGRKGGDAPGALNPYRMFYMLDFARAGKRKISFSTSFGAGDDTADFAVPHYAYLLKQYSDISVREQVGADICRDKYGVKATQIIEPVFSVDKSLYHELGERSKLREKEPYLLTYILDPTPEKRKAIQHYSKRLGMKAVNILDGHFFGDTYTKNVERLSLPNTLPNINACDFLWYYRDAAFVISDSFHGAAFAIIFNKPFISIANYKRGIARFEDLLGKVGFLDRLVRNPEEIPEDDRYLGKMDFGFANSFIAAERERAVAWLKDAVNHAGPRDVAIARDIPSALPEEDCMGCGACVSACPADALSLAPDEYGYYRSTLDRAKCTNCGICKMKCPAWILPEKGNDKAPKAYAFVCADKDTRWASSSGGAFSELAKAAFARGGVVFGVAWRDDLSAAHVMVDNEADLPKLRRSKYMQSYLGDTFRKVKAKLDGGTFVLFTGCPCQVAGLKAYLGKECDRLLLVDLLCGSCPSAGFFRNYADEAFGEGGVRRYDFRIKQEGVPFNCSTVAVATADGKTAVRHGNQRDAFLEAFHSQTLSPAHCRKCPYQGLPRYGDLTIGDFWGIRKVDPAIESERGVSAILVNNGKGAGFLKQIPKQDVAVMKEEPLKAMAGYNKLAFAERNWPRNPRRDKFYELISQMSFSHALESASNVDAFGAGKDALTPPDVMRKEALPPLGFFSSRAHFVFDRNCFDEHFVNGLTVLTVRPGFGGKAGVRALLPLNAPLEKGRSYEISARFKICSDADEVNFHIYNTSEKKYQVVKNVKFKRSTGMTGFRKTFTPNAEGYDSMMVGAYHIKGEHAYFALDFCAITEI